MKVTQEQALEALDRLYGQGCATCDQNNEEGFCAEDDFLVVSQYIEGRELFIPCDEGTAPAISRATDERGHKVVILAEEIYDGLTYDAEGQGWQDIESAPRDGELFMLRRVYPEITEYWSCWFCPAEKTLDGEIEGEAWILNDDEKQLIVGEEDHGYEWKPIEPPQEKS